MIRRYITVLFLFLAITLMADWSAGVVQSYSLSADPDMEGTVGSPAVIYAQFTFAGSLSFKLEGPDVWAIYDLSPGEDISQEEPILIVNDGGIVVDLAFHLGSEDIVTAPDAAPWTSRDNWAGSVTPSEYALGLILCDPSVTTGPGIMEFEVDDILRPGSPVWYLAAGQFRPFTSSLAYEHEGAVSLGLLGSEGMNKVHAFMRVQLTRSGSLDDYPHAARVVVTCRMSSG